ncbi:MAG TPA: hypothetical protein VLE94_05655 [Burkholderiaceae bacterium]|nr:hypothetical protein [Burkholderiaceae bacterium]
MSLQQDVDSLEQRSARTMWAGRWKTHFVLFVLTAAALTAFLMHLGAIDPWIGGTVLPATAWIAWIAVGIARASRRRCGSARE